MARAGRIIAAFSALLAMQAAPREEFVWQSGGHTIGRLNSPTGFAIETDNYRERIVTTLRYTDGGIHRLAIGRHVPSTHISGLGLQTHFLDGTGGKDNQGGANRWLDAVPG